MKTKIDAVKTLLAAGWTEVEITTIMGGAYDLSDSTHTPKNTPWWDEIDDDEYLNGSPMVGEWELLLSLNQD